MFSADCFWGQTLSPVARPPRSSPSPLPVEALAKAWTLSVCHRVSQTTQRPRRALSRPWTHLMSLKKRYQLHPFAQFPMQAHDTVFATWGTSVCKFITLEYFESHVFKRCQKQSSLWGLVPYRNRSKSNEHVSFFIQPLKYCSVPTSKGHGRIVTCNMSYTLFRRCRIFCEGAKSQGTETCLAS